MNDRERVLSMLEEGKISPEEAEKLLAVLSDIEDVEDEVSAFEEASSRVAEVDKAVTAFRQPEEKTQAKPQPEDYRPKDLNWVEISVMAGNLDIKVDGSITSPQVDGNATVEQNGKDFVISPLKTKPKPKRQEGIDGLIEDVSDWVSNMVGRVTGDLDIRIPENYGVVVHSKAGDVDIRDIPFLKGSLLAGDVDAKNIGGIDLSLSAGDIDISVRPTKGKHRIKATAGDVDVQILEGSSLTLNASVSMGDMDIRRKDGSPVQQQRRVMGGNAMVQIGSAEASLDIHLSAGDLDVVIHE